MRHCASVPAGGMPAVLLLLSLLSAFSAMAGEEEPVLNCDPPCVNGKCMAYFGNLSCQCVDNWSGKDCSYSICDEDKCLNGGTCYPDPNDLSRYLCSCPLPYFGNICQYTTEAPPNPEPQRTTTLVPITVTILVVVLLGLVAGVVVRKRKVIRAKIFYPTRPQVYDLTHDQSPSSKRGKVAQNDLASRTLISSTEESYTTASCTSGDYIREGSKLAKMEGSGKITWTDYKVTVGDSPGHDPSDVAVVSQVGKDPRNWNSFHYSAVRNPEVMRELLEKCHRDDSKECDVNTPGPGGYTPLMLAVTQKTPDGFPLSSRSSSSSDSSGKHSDHHSLPSPTAKTIQLVPHSDTRSPSGSLLGSHFNRSVDVLLAARVKLDATNDYGRTALHLAAVCAKGDYVRKLLVAGANPNAQDNWGQTALHAAIGAAAEGAFHMLLDFPKTDFNLESDGGTTPLMDAVKTTNMYMVKQLVKKNSDITITDCEGRTAVHWAAMTENVEALKLLIRKGPDTIMDAQDNKGQTALFLACREGATECVCHLLDVFANTTLLDDLDRSPMAIASERQHLCIIEMLESHVPYHYQLPVNGHSVPHHMQVAQHHEMTLPHQQADPSYSHHPPTSHLMPPALEHYPGPEMEPPWWQTFGDVEYPVSSSMELGLSESASYEQMNNMMLQATESTGAYAPTAVDFYPPSTSSQTHPYPPSNYLHHLSPLTQLQAQPTTSFDLPDSYSQPHPATAYPTSTVTYAMGDSEQQMVNELIMSISECSPPQHPNSASSVNSNRSPPGLYPSPPNSDALHHPSEVAQQNGSTMVPYASLPSLTHSPEGSDEAAQQNITPRESLVQQHRSSGKEHMFEPQNILHTDGDRGGGGPVTEGLQEHHEDSLSISPGSYMSLSERAVPYQQPALHLCSWCL